MRVSRTVENLIYFFILRCPEVDAQTIYNIWQTNIILREYKRPSIGHLELLIVSIREELEETGVKFN